MATPCELITEQMGLLYTCLPIGQYIRIQTPFLYLKFRLNRNQRPQNLAGGDLKRVKFQYIQLQKKELYSNERYHIAAHSSRDLCLF